MEESRFPKCGLVAVDGRELQLRGGVSWKEIMQLLAYVERILRYVGEYEDDARRGFKKGWRML